jgi:hypothetical protein
MPQLEKFTFIIQVLPIFVVLAVLYGLLNREHYIIFDWVAVAAKRKRLLIYRGAWFTSWGFHYRGQKGYLWQLFSPALVVAVAALYQVGGVLAEWDRNIVALLREGAVVNRLGCRCRWLYKRELSRLEESEGHSYTIQNQFGDRFYSKGASTHLVQILTGLTHSGGLRFSFLISYLQQFEGFLPPTGLCDQCYTAKCVAGEWSLSEREVLPLTMGVLTVGEIPALEEDDYLFEDPLAKTDRFQSRRVGGAGVEGHFPICVVPGQLTVGSEHIAPYTLGPEEVVFTTGSGSFQTPLYAAAGSKFGSSSSIEEDGNLFDTFPFLEDEILRPLVGGEESGVECVTQEQEYEEDSE